MWHFCLSDMFVSIYITKKSDIYHFLMNKRFDLTPFL